MKCFFRLILLLYSISALSQNCQTIDFQLDSALPNLGANGFIKICVNQPVTVQGSAVFSDNANGAVYQWDLGDGNTASGTSATFSYPIPGVYIVNLTVSGVTPVRCDTSTDIDLVVQVSTEPDFTKTEAQETVLCFGESTILYGEVSTTTFDNSCTPPEGNTTSLPDGVGVSYETSVFVDCFEPNTTLSNISQLESICFNMEHSFIGDLHIDIIAPNGQTVRILESVPGTTANFGIPWADGVRGDATGILTPGIGSEYCILPDNNLPTLIEGIQNGGTFPLSGGPATYTDDYVPEGDYRAVEPLDGLIGSPLNGNWRLRITDNIGADNGTIFSWSLNFDPSILPVDYSFTPIIASEGWDPDPSIIAFNGSDIRVQPATAGIHCFTYRIVDDFGCEYTKEVCVDVIRDINIENQPVTVYKCDERFDNTEEFYFTDNENLIIGNQPSSEVVVTYYLDEADAIANRNPINLPHNSIQLTETIWVRIADLTQTCFEIASFEINVVPIPIAQTPTDYEVCDDTSIGTDSDGLVSGFDLTTKINEVRGNLAASDFDVRFYYSQADADNRNTANEITGPIANTVNPQPIYARIEHNATNECYDTTSFNLVVNELAVIISSDVTLEQCDDDTDGISLFNLTEANSLITATANQTITYYQTLAEAQGGLVADQITNYINYPNDVNPASPLNEIFARIENSFGCYRTARIQLVVGVSQIPPTFQTLAYTQCDNANDGDDRNGITTFDFSDAQAQIEALFPGGVTVTFYNNQADALAELNAIPDLSNHRNDASPGVQNIYVRVDSNVLNGCLGLGHHVTLTVEALPMANPVTFATQCEDDPTDIEISYPFDTTNLESDLLQGQTNVLVDYFDANGNPLTDINNNPITSPFPNTFRTETQTITARVTNAITNTNNNIPCYDETEIAFTVDIQPQAFPVTITPLCDDGINQIETTDGMSSFDTSGIQDIILGGQTGMDITYTDANGTVLPTPLPNPFQTATQIVTARVSNPANPSCEASIPLDFIVNPLPQFEVEDDRVVCTNLEESIVLEVLNPQASDYTYSWTNSAGQEISTQPQVTVSIPDDYTVIATSNQGCPSLPRMINVAESTQPTTTIDDITIVENSSNNSITINNVEGRGYDFALDNEFGPYQDEPFFSNVLAGMHTVYVRSKEGCGTAIIEVYILGFPKFMTPNGDGYHDRWQVLGLGGEYENASKVSIYDRYGKLLKQMTAKDNAWDGTFNGYRLPSSDYWFVAELVMTSGEVKVYKDHFSLKR